MWWLGAVAQGAWERSRSHLRVEVECEKARGWGVGARVGELRFNCWSSLCIWISQGLCFLFPKF